MKLIKLISLLWFVFALGCFSSIAKDKDKKETPEFDQLELQEDLQRFYTSFTQRLVEAFTDPKLGLQQKPDLWTLAMRQYLLYDTEALKIVTGPYPEVNLMDLLVFVRLNKAVMKEHWVPRHFGKKSKVIVTAFEESEKDLTEISQKLLNPAQLAGIYEIAAEWRYKNPKQIRVEKVRLADFAKVASESSKRRIEENKEGFSLSDLVVNTKSAVQAVDQMVLVANRGIFLAQQMPSIMRIQTRLGIQEVFDDVIRKAGGLNTKELLQAGPLLNDMTDLSRELNQLVRRSNELMASVQKTFPEGIHVDDHLKGVNKVLDKSNVLVTQLQEQQESNNDLLQSVNKEFKESVIFLSAMIIIVTAIIAFICGGTYYIVKKKLRQI